MASSSRPIPGYLTFLGTVAMASGLALGAAAAQDAQTDGQRAAAEAARLLAEGQADEPVVLNAPKPDARRVYVQDPAHFAAITQQFAIDGETGRVVGITDGGFLPQPLVADDGSFIAQASTVFSRIARGTRTDYVEVFDPETFEPTADIELPKDARFLIGTYQWMNALTPDKKKLLFYQFSPAPAVGIVDLEGKKFDRMVDVPDCYHIFPASPTVFYMNCRDGSLARVDIAETEPKITNTEVFHAEDELLINHPAYSMRAGRLVWPTYTGKIFQIDLTEEKATFREPIEALTEAERADNWRPGGWQQTAYHRASDRIFLLVDQRDQWRHKTASRFVVVLDAATGERISKIELGHEIDSINVSQDAEPLLYALSAGTQTLHIFDAGTGKELRKVTHLGRGPQILTTHDMGS
ncbi:methylamine dehydrogenase (amicyanin) large subunit (plasmid) [Paracoccus yeei]|uniref:Methylamine dehydrogenase heavy chain n=1 Tax=Paracoccus yeei TaxID=147645 RepID=A0A1V0GYS5_9RHOB|nr:methylamine dehydrogenase (amicyanin) large subunit [Paracoccus yeei]ARC38972.1 methylamine dehydrogenase (amicyanin) large subunit [Paracoccus yeei]ATQ58411.1 methylamine dehydrogenase (amicyanin) large subunit [Paracoccus yeei]AYF03391.1 methylamine dehydrogenase (amicyanin) large subunit [Paracoccus yeei]